MNELNNQGQKKPEKASARGHRKKPVARSKRPVGPSVTYAADELIAVEGEPFWNDIHDGQIKSETSDGVVVSVKKNNDSIDVFVPNEELLLKDDISPGQGIRVYVEDGIDADEKSEHPFKGSEIKAVDLDLVHKAQRAKENNETVKGYVVGEIKGGYSVALFADSRELLERGYGLRAFLPLGRTGVRRGEGLEGVDEHEIEVQISEFDPVRGNIVVSRRELLVEERKKALEAFFTSHREGDEVIGRVTAIMPYGAFVDLGGVDGFLHISDVSWDKKPKLKDLVPMGSEVRAKIIGLDTENKKVKLSIKDLNVDPWQAIEKSFKPGSEVEGDIVAFADFGAFVRLRDGVEGLIHVGEITWNRIKHPSQHFKIGDHVRALVLRVDKEARRISLSTKAIEQSPVERLSVQFPIGSVIKTRIASIHEFGLFVELDEGKNGLVPRSEVSWVRSDLPLEKTFSVGQEIEVAVLGYDSKRQRVTCSIKRTEEDPWEKWKSKFRKGASLRVKVLEVSRAGVVCQLEGDLTSFCPKSQLLESDSDEGRIRLKVGDEIDVVVTAVDMSRHRISISQRAAAESETKKAYESYLSEQGRGGASRTTLADALRNADKFKERRR